MAWDDDKSDFEQRDDVPNGQKVTSAEWDAMVADQQNRTLPEDVEDIVGALVAGGTNVTATYDDANDTLTIDTSALNEEEVEDAVAALIAAGNAVTVNYDDANDALTVAVDESALSFYDGTNLTAPVDNQSVTTETHNTVPQIRPRVTGGSGDGTGTPPGSDPYTFDESVIQNYAGLVRFGEGRYITSGLELDTSEDYEKDATYFAGDGIRATELEHEDGSSPTIKFQAGGSSGNFGGVRNMTVYGAGSGTGTANIVESNSDIIDLIFRNVIFRYGGGDALNIGGASGARVQNAWLENVPGWGLSVSGGSRAKISNVHITATGQGAYIDVSNSYVSGISVGTTTSGVGVRVGTVSDTTINGIYTEGAAGTGFECNGAERVTNVTVNDASGIGMEFINTSITASNLRVHSGAPTYGIRVRNSSDQLFSNVSIEASDNDGLFIDGADRAQVHNLNIMGNLGRDGIRVNANQTMINGLDVTQASVTDTVHVVSGATDTRIYNARGVTWSNVTDNGTRTVINGVGLNAGDPNSTGDWNGNGYEGLKVRDTTNANTYLYNDGSYSQIASA